MNDFQGKILGEGQVADFLRERDVESQISIPPERDVENQISKTAPESVTASHQSLYTQVDL